MSVQAIKDSYSVEMDKVDGIKVRATLTENGVIKDKRAMPSIQAFKVRFDHTSWGQLVCVETHVGNWRQQCVPSNVAIPRVRS